jgi:transposase
MEGVARRAERMRRYELRDDEWAIIEPLIPPPAPTGRPRRAPREMWNAIFWVLRSGALWRDLPERFGPWESAYFHFNTWRRQGVFERVLETLQVRLDAEGHIDWDLWSVDGSSVRASRAAAGAGKKGAPTSPKTTRWAARAADSGAKSTWWLTATAIPSRRTSRPGRSTSARSSKRS